MTHETNPPETAGLRFRNRWILSGSGEPDDDSPDEAGLPQTIGRAEYCVDAPRPGLEVYSFKAHLKSSVMMSSETVGESPYLWIAMNFVGTCEYAQSAAISGVATDHCGYLALLKEPPVRFNYGVGGHYSAGVAISRPRLRAMLQDRVDDERIERFLDGRFASEVIAYRSTETMRRIGDQIDGNPYQGRLRDVYLEGKALEMMAEVFHVALDGRAREEGCNVRRCAYEAREIMMHDPRSPPFIADVARMVGVSQRKLIDIFREVFGATPLQCLVLWRLERARALLQEGNLSVKQVSYMVGYNYESNFSLAFTRRFGFPPSTLNRHGVR